ncbi:hypothetical protein [Mycobacterium sp. DL440]|nr:hypothetical protein [Mycobacterium sp. DL440]
MMINLLFYGVPLLVIVVTLWVGFLGWRFYLQQVVRDKESEESPS